MEILEKLGLNLQSFLFHMLSLAIIVFAAWFLLRKPIARMIKKQNEKLLDVANENARLISAAEESNRSIEAVKTEAKEEAMRITNIAAASAAAASDSILETAQAQAKSILETAHKEARAEFERVKEDCGRAVTDASLAIAEKILSREIDKSDNRKIVDDCIKELLS